MASKINICSMATSLIGANRVSDLDNPTSEEEKLCVLWWDHCVKEALETHDWKFARDYKAALAVSASPNAEYDHAYQLPDNCLILRYLWDADAAKRVTDSEYELHGSEILTDLDTVNVVYTKNDVAVGVYPTHFVKALIYLLASYLAYKLAEKRRDSMYEAYMKAVQEGIDRDQAQGNYPETATDSWLAAAGVGEEPSGTRIVQTNSGYIEV